MLFIVKWVVTLPEENSGSVYRIGFHVYTHQVQVSDTVIQAQ
jgi:hypothetical protein